MIEWVPAIEKDNPHTQPQDNLNRLFLSASRADSEPTVITP